MAAPAAAPPTAPISVPGPRLPPIARPKSPPTTPPTTAPPTGFPCWSWVVCRIHETSPSRSGGGATHVVVVVRGVTQAASGTSTTAARQRFRRTSPETRREVTPGREEPHTPARNDSACRRDRLHAIRHLPDCWRAAWSPAPQVEQQRHRVSRSPTSGGR